MAENLKLQYCTPGLGPGEAILLEECENELFACLLDSWGECHATLLNLAIFYGKTGKQERAVSFVKHLLELSDEPEEQARYLLMLAQLMEEIEDYDSSKVYYEQALELELYDEITLYFMHNNFGYLLNQMGFFEEARPHLERAISIDPERHNGYKNLAMACEGLGRLEEAVECYITATQSEPYDARSLVLLENLLNRHPELFVKAPHLQSRLDRCKSQVKIAQAEIPEVTIH